MVESTWQRPLTGSLAALCGSCLPGAVTALPFHTESRRAAAVVILSDTTLTVLATDHASTQITQVLYVQRLFSVVRPRERKPCIFHRFLFPLLQTYDFVNLHGTAHCEDNL